MNSEDWRGERNAEARRRYRENGGRLAHAEHVRRTYRMSRGQYDAMLAEQGGVCAICKQPEVGLSRTGKVRRLAVDHCHRTGQVRALLCVRCNLKVGHLEPALEGEPAIIEAALAYIEEWRNGFANAPQILT